MLFVLDESLSAVLGAEEGELFETACFELERLAVARQRRKLVLFIDSDRVSRSLMSCDRLSNRAKSVFAFCARSRTFEGGLMKKLKRRVRIVASGDIALEVSPVVTEVRVPIASVPHGLFELPVLMGEHINDAKCYLLLARSAWTWAASGVRNVNVAAELRGGGGSAIEGEYANIKDAAERNVLCVLDSDMTHPQCQPSAWRARILVADQRQVTALADSMCADVYSIENLLPPHCMLDLEPYVNDQNVAYAIRRDLEVWEQLCQSAVWKYLPLKKGLRCNTIRENDARGEFLRSAAGDLMYSSKGCVKSPVRCGSVCHRVPPFPKDFVEQFVLRYEKSSNEELNSALGEFHKRGETGRLLTQLVAWLCIGRPVGVLAAG